jgi:hypothetical protein
MKKNQGWNGESEFQKMMKSFLFGSKFFDFIDFKNEPN